MENENKEKVILTDEELKEVTGGVKITNASTITMVKNKCRQFNGTGNAAICNKYKDCTWIGHKCVPNPDIYEY